MSHVVVLGADIIGITTAYFLTKAGHRLTVIERNSHAGLETSYANGRAATPKGTPILGPSPIANLFLNAGHGALGWTLSCGCAKAVSDLISGVKTDIALEGLTLES